MSEASAGGSSTSSPILVEDLFLTSRFLIKGRFVGKYGRLAKMLEDVEDSFITIGDATMISLQGKDVIRTPAVRMNPREIILAHELIEIAGDAAQRELAENQKTTRIRAFYCGSFQLELAGQIAPGAYDPSRGPARRYFIMQDPALRGLRIDERKELGLLEGLSYAIVRKDKLSYVYDFG